MEIMIQFCQPGIKEQKLFCAFSIDVGVAFVLPLCIFTGCTLLVPITHSFGYSLDFNKIISPYFSSSGHQDYIDAETLYPLFLMYFMSL